MTANRTKGELYFWLVVDFTFVIWMGVLSMRSWSTHHGDLFTSAIWLLWIGKTWRDLHRWTGPPISQRRKKPGNHVS